MGDKQAMVLVWGNEDTIVWMLGDEEAMALALGDELAMSVVWRRAIVRVLCDELAVQWVLVTKR